jgi:hypothetical protein
VEFTARNGERCEKMKKHLIAGICILVFLFATALQAAKQEKQGKKAAPPVINTAIRLAEELQKRGITGKETGEGVLPKIFTLLGLRQYRGIAGHDYSVGIYDFKSASGFTIADGILHFYDMLSDDAVYKSRPYIICVNYENEEVHKKILAVLRQIIPEIKEAGEKEF